MKNSIENLDLGQIKEVYLYIKENVNSTMKFSDFINILEETYDVPIFRNIDEWYLYQIHRNEPWKYELELDKLNKGLSVDSDNVDSSYKYLLLRQTIDSGDKNTTIIGKLIVELENLY